MCAMLAEKIRRNQNNQESEHQDEHIPQQLCKLKLLIMMFKVCVEKDCTHGCMIHEHRGTCSNGSDETKMTKTPSIKMSTFCDIYVIYIYHSCC